LLLRLKLLSVQGEAVRSAVGKRKALKILEALDIERAGRALDDLSPPPPPATRPTNTAL
jgi:hypothetical protein